MTRLSLDLGRGRRVALWLDELPTAPLGAEEAVLETDLPADPSVSCWRDICVEVKIPLGARRLYGLLGATFAMRDAPRLHVVVPICEQLRTTTIGVGAAAAEDVRSGLSPDYAYAIIERLSANEPPGSYKPGVIIFNRALHSSVGSSSVVFRNLASLIIDLMFASEERLGAEPLNARIGQALEDIVSGR